MKSNKKEIIKNTLISIFILSVASVTVILLQKISNSQSTVPMIYVLAVFIAALTTKGYLYGFFASLMSVLIVNFAFTFPYFEFNFSIYENLVSAFIMLIVAASTSTLTAKIKEQEKLRAETNTEKMRANLLRAISHDLRTPLTTIYGSCSAIIENYDSLSKENKVRLLSEMREDSENLIRIVENLLSVTKVREGSVKIQKTPTMIEELIDSVLIKFHKTYKDQEVTVNIPDDFIFIPVDALLIEQVLINILENAMHHATGMTELNISVHTKNNNAVFEITDNGCGIPKNKLSNIFKQQFESSGTFSDSNRKGMGIGLSVCSAIINAHGGTIEAENRKSGGALFRITLKMEESDYEQ